MEVERKLKCSLGIGKIVTATALVAQDDFSARYDLDRIEGVFSRPAHALYGQSYVGKVLILNTAKGGVATSWMLKDMVDRSKAPVALVLNSANPIMAQGAAFANLTLVHQFEGDITEEIFTGQTVTVDPMQGLLTTYRVVQSN